jgi:hypothetical protein
MKPMLDKDFDQLFKSSFEDYEVTPTANSWDKIADSLYKNPASKKKFPFYWASAASIIFILGIGISMYLKPTEVIQLRPDQPKEKLAETTNLANEVKPSTHGTEVATESEIENKKEIVPEEKQRKFLADNTAFTDKKNDVNTQNDVFKVNSTEDRNLPENTESVKTVGVNQKMLVNKDMGKMPMISIAPEAVLAQNEMEDIDKSNVDNGKLKIKSIGDIVNFVVSKVDKREDKIIKMSKTENSDNEITEINLGLFSFKRSY